MFPFGSTARLVRKAANYVHPDPVATIQAEAAQLARPEAVAFTPGGDLKAVANSKSNSVAIYPTSGDRAYRYATEPCCVLRDARLLRFVHGVAFCPDGRLLAAVGRESHTAVIYRRKEGGAEFHREAVWEMRGVEQGISYPTSIAFHPSGRNLVVCNRTSDTSVACFDRIPEEDGLFRLNPTRSVGRETLVARGLAPPHGLAFSPDGHSMLACHKHFGKSDDRRGRPGISAFDWPSAASGITGNRPKLVLPLRQSIDKRLHSIAVHPAGEIVAVTDPQFGTSLFRADSGFAALSLVGRLPYQWDADDPVHKKGPKGVAFTPDGAYMVITIAQHRVWVYRMV